MILSEAIQKRVLKLCEGRNITINKLSTICGITQSTIDYMIKRNDTKTSVSTIKKICDGLEITLAEFFDTKEFNELEQEIK